MCVCETETGDTSARGMRRRRRWRLLVVVVSIVWAQMLWHERVADVHSYGQITQITFIV